MFNNTVLDVIISLVFIYLLYSLLATSVQEIISTILHRRANTLYDGIKSMLSDTRKDMGFIPNFIIYTICEPFINIANRLLRIFTGEKEPVLYAKFYDHPIIKNYGQNFLFKKPSYLTPENFSSILIETLKNLDPDNKTKPATFLLLKSTIEAKQVLIDSDTRSIINYHLNEAAGDLDVFKYRIDKWYNDTMDRVSGWYKRNTQFYLLALGLIMAISLNVDSIEITNFLSDNKPARDQLAKMGEAAANNQNYAGGDSIIAKEALDSIKASINKVNTLVGLGWGDYGKSDTAFKSKILKNEKLHLAYLANKPKADSIFDADLNLLQEAYNKLNDSIQLKKILNDSLILLKQKRKHITDQQQFSMLYENDDFENALKKEYIWYRMNLKKFFGFLITALAISLGAPFWFDLLNKFVSLRTAVKTVNSSGSTTKNNTSDNNEIDG